LNSWAKVSAVLLAAGRSRRMGAFKPLLPFGLRTVIEACAANLHAGGAREVLVVVGHRGDEVRAAVGHLPFVRFAVNEETESEMGVSVARGVAALPDDAEAMLVALVDQPAVPPAVVSTILSARERTGARLIIPVWGGRGGHPVFVDLSFRAELLTLAPERGLRAVFEKHAGEVLRLPVGSPFVARDMDTWDDYRLLHTDVFGCPPPDLGEMG
jgi:molybdenum cofactor cytidylyltransferase